MEYNFSDFIAYRNVQILVGMQVTCGFYLYRFITDLLLIINTLFR